MRAYVYSDNGGYRVLYTSNGEIFDDADGFDDEIEAVEAARRGVYGIGTVQIAGNYFRPEQDRPWREAQ